MYRKIGHVENDSMFSIMMRKKNSIERFSHQKEKLNKKNKNDKKKMMISSYWK